MIGEAMQRPPEAEAASHGYGLDLTRYVLRVRRAWAANAVLYSQLLSSGRFDAVVGDETYELNIAQMRNPGMNQLPYFCLFDFLGMDAVGRNPLNHLIAYRWNWTWAHDGALFRRPGRTALFVGELDDVPDRRFGPFLPNRRRHASDHYRFVGYILGFDPSRIGDRRELRASLGYGDEPLVLCSVGGTAVGIDLLRLCAEAYPALDHRLPGVRLVLVAGPRIDPESVQVPAGVEVRGYVPELHRHFAASDLCVVQGGGTTTLELTALRRPFLYFPLEGHAEQEVGGRPPGPRTAPGSRHW